MITHTPGPWETEGPDDESYGDIVVKAQSRHVCRLWQDDAPVHDYNADQWANARLVAAAPDLLAELKSNRDMLIELRDNHLYGAAAVTRAIVQHRIEAADAAIAKATGGDR